APAAGRGPATPGHGPADLRGPRPPALGRAGRSGAAGHLRAEPAAPARAVGRAVPAGTADRSARGRGPVQPGDRPAAVPVAPDRGLAPVTPLSQAGNRLPDPAPAGAGSGRSRFRPAAMSRFTVRAH